MYQVALQHMVLAAVAQPEVMIVKRSTLVLQVLGQLGQMFQVVVLSQLLVEPQENVVDTTTVQQELFQVGQMCQVVLQHMEQDLAAAQQQKSVKRLIVVVQVTLVLGVIH